MHAMFCTFFWFWQSKNYWNQLRFDRYAVKCTFYEPRQKCTFWFFQVRCTHRSGDVINFIIVVCRVSLRLKWYKNYKNWLRLAKVIVRNNVSRLFYGSLCINRGSVWKFHQRWFVGKEELIKFLKSSTSGSWRSVNLKTSALPCCFFTVGNCHSQLPLSELVPELSINSAYDSK